MSAHNDHLGVSKHVARERMMRKSLALVVFWSWPKLRGVSIVAQTEVGEERSMTNGP